MTSDRGSATVEFALVLPAAIAMLGAVLGTVAWAQQALIAQDAASTAARVAITDSISVAVSAGQRVAGSDARVEVERAGGWITATVTLPSRGLVPATAVTATAREQP